MLLHKVSSFGLLSVLVLCASSFQGSGQTRKAPPATSDVPLFSLSARETVPVELNVGPYEIPIKCDSDGNMYLRPVADPNSNLDSIVKIGANGKIASTFSFQNLGDIKASAALDFVVLRGEVYALITDKNGGDHLVRFRSDGTYNSEITLPTAEMQISRFATFSMDQVLMTGMNSKTSRAETLLVDRSGNVSHLINTKEQFQLDRNGELSHTDRLSVTLSSLVPGDDGNIYLMRQSSHPVIFAISPNGEVLKQFTIKSPDGSYRPLTMSIGAGKIAVVFQENKPPVGSNIARQIYRVVDEYSGEVQADYSSKPEIWGGFACYVAPAQFSLLMPQKDGRFALVKATP